MTRLLNRILLIEPLWIGLLGLPVVLGQPILVAAYPYAVIGLVLLWPLRWLAYVLQPTDSASSDRSKDARQPRRGRRSFVRPLASPISLPILLIVVLLPISLFVAIEKTRAWEVAGYLLYGIVWYVALINWRPARRQPFIAPGLLLAIGCLLALASPPLVAWKPQARVFQSGFYSFMDALSVDVGETIHANVLAGALVLALPLLAALVLAPIADRRPVRHRWHQLLALLLIWVLALLILTQSRAAYLATVLSLALVVVLLWPRLIYLFLPLGVAFLAAVLMLDSSAPLDFFRTDETFGGWSGRMEIWMNAGQALHDFPFTGIGIGGFTTVLPLLYPLHVSIEDYPHAHNLFLQIGLDLGLSGLAIYLAIVLNLFAMLAITWHNRHRFESPAQLALLIGACGGLLALLAHGLLDAVSWGTRLAFLPWILFAIITQLHASCVPSASTDHRVHTEQRLLSNRPTQT